MSTAGSSNNAYAYNRSQPRYSFTGGPGTSSPYLEALDREQHAIAYTAARSAYATAIERESLAGNGRRMMVLAAAALAGLVCLSLMIGLARSPVGARASRWPGAGPVVGLIRQITAAQDEVAAAPAAPTRAADPAPAQPADDGSRPAVAHHTSDYNVMAPPSISAAQIDQVLGSWQSPASGSGAVFYDLGVKYGIDPAYALAFYIHESAAGTKGVARFTHGIGNIRTTPGYADYEGYRSYPTFAAGIEDWYKLIKELYVDGWGLTTPDAIIQRYAPWGDNNNPVVYANNVKQLVDSWQTK